MCAHQSRGSPRTRVGRGARWKMKFRINIDTRVDTKKLTPRGAAPGRDGREGTRGGEDRRKRSGRVDKSSEKKKNTEKRRRRRRLGARRQCAYCVNILPAQQFEPNRKTVIRWIFRVTAYVCVCLFFDPAAIAHVWGRAVRHSATLALVRRQIKCAKSGVRKKK